MPIASLKTKVACKLCNQRRVRCDRTDQTPCSRCRANGQECEPIVSKRGKHKRDRIQRFRFQHSLNQVPATSQPSTNSLEASSTHSQPDSQTATTGSIEDSGVYDSSTLLRSSAESHADATEAQNSRTIYYGDYFNLEYTRKELDENHEDYRPRMNGTYSLHVDRLGYPTKKLVEDHAKRERARLDELGAFDTLDSRVSEQLIRTFFELIYPVAPVVDRTDFYLKFRAGRVSPLVLQAVYLVVFSHCELSLLIAAGYENRYMATFTCYQRAKALYDAGYESDAIALLQALYYLSVWWESPTQQKDMWYWTGIIVDLAQSLGMHQERTYSGLNRPEKKLWRRIWWCIYSRDISIAVQLGRIPHVNDGYCTTNPLTEQDVEEDLPEGFHLSANATKESHLYTIYQADLCLRVSKCHRSLYGVHADPQVALRDVDSLASWKTALPGELQCRRATFTLHNGLLSSVLNLCACAFEILLRRNFFQNPQVIAVGTPAFDAAVEIVRILENLLTSELLTVCPLQILPGTFAALSVLITNMHRPTSEISDVSRHRARLCMLVLSKLIDYWPPLLLYYRLFARILASRGCQVPDEPINFSTQNQLGNREQQTSPTREGELNYSHTAGGFPRSDSISGEAELLGMTSLFPFSAFLNEEFFDNDLGTSLPVNCNPPSP